MTTDPLVRTDEQVERRHGPIRLVDGRQDGQQIEAACTDGLNHTGERRLRPATFETRDGRLGRSDAVSQRFLGETTPAPRLPDQRSALHVQLI